MTTTTTTTTTTRKTTITIVTIILMVSLVFCLLYGDVYECLTLKFIVLHIA